MVDPRAPRAVALAALVAVATLLSGCVRYAAPVDRTIERGALRFRLKSISGTRAGATHVVFRIDETPGNVRLLDASLTEAGLGCGVGVPAKRLGRTAATTFDAPLAAGERVTLAFQVSLEALTKTPLELALRVSAPNGHARCLRLPVTGTEAPLRLDPQQSVTVGAELGILGLAEPLGPVTQAVTLPVTAGVWIGRYHVNAAIGPAWAGCAEPYCTAPSETQLIRYATGLVAMAGIGRPILHAGLLGVDAVLRYRFMTLPADTKTGSQLVLAHGPTLEPIIGLVMPPIPGVPHSGGSREVLFGAGVPLGYMFADNGNKAFLWGLDLRLFFTVF